VSKKVWETLDYGMTTFLNTKFYSMLFQDVSCYNRIHTQIFAFISLTITVASVYILSLHFYISSNCHLHLVLCLHTGNSFNVHLTVPPVVANT